MVKQAWSILNAIQSYQAGKTILENSQLCSAIWVQEILCYVAKSNLPILLYISLLFGSQTKTGAVVELISFNPYFRGFEQVDKTSHSPSCLKVNILSHLIQYDHNQRCFPRTRIFWIAWFSTSKWTLTWISYLSP